MTLRQRDNRRHKLGQGRAQRHHGQTDHGIRHTQRLRNQRAVVHQQSCADGNEHRADHQQQNVLPEGMLRRGALRVLVFGKLGMPAHLHHRCHHVDHKSAQQHDAAPALEAAGGIRHGQIESRRQEEADDGQPEAVAVHPAGADGHGQRGNEAGIAND